MNDTIHQSVAALQARIAAQQILLDRAAGIIVEALVSDDGINKAQANACVDAIRGGLAEVGKTTVEHNFERLCNRIASVAGLRMGEEFNPLSVLDLMAATISAQARNAARLALLIPLVWHDGKAGRRPWLKIGRGGGNKSMRFFPPGTTWLEAIDTVLGSLKAVK